MACFRPMTAWRSSKGRDPRTGKWPIVFQLKDGFVDMPITVPCGQCIGCRLERSRQWAIRCLHESSLYDKNCFLTLTYNNDFIDRLRTVNTETGEVVYSLSHGPSCDIELFLKRYRKRFGVGIRFFQCGEYGEVCSYCGLSRKLCTCLVFKPSIGRPHHHVMIFNHDFLDRDWFQTRDGIHLYTSESLKELWPFGFSTIGDVTFESAAYVARYVTKKITGDRAPEHYGGREPEFITMSRRPGIGREWFDRFYSDIYTTDSCVVRPGLVARPPAYYDHLYDIFNPEDFAKIKSRRIKLAKLSEHNTFQRLAVRERVQELKFTKLIRPGESDGFDQS